MNKESYLRCLADASACANQSINTTIHWVTEQSETSDGKKIVREVFQSPCNPTLAIARRFMEECSEIKGDCDRLTLALNPSLATLSGDNADPSKKFMPYMEGILGRVANLSIVMGMASTAIFQAPLEDQVSIATLRFFCKATMLLQKMMYSLIEPHQNGWKASCPDVGTNMNGVSLGFAARGNPEK